MLNSFILLLFIVFVANSLYTGNNNMVKIFNSTSPIFVAIEGNGIFMSVNDGIDYTKISNITDPYYISKLGSYVGFCSLNGSLSISSDHGDTWRNTQVASFTSCYYDCYIGMFTLNYDSYYTMIYPDGTPVDLTYDGYSVIEKVIIGNNNLVFALNQAGTKVIDNSLIIYEYTGDIIMMDSFWTIPFVITRNDTVTSVSYSSGSSTIQKYVTYNITSFSTNNSVLNDINDMFGVFVDGYHDVYMTHNFDSYTKLYSTNLFIDSIDVSIHGDQIFITVRNNQVVSSLDYGMTWSDGYNNMFHDTPSSQPSSQPTNSPSGYPTSQPTNSPSSYPTSQPTNSPSSYPTNSPSSYPTSQPTNSPSGYPTSQPTNSPSSYPTSQPTNSPSGYPTSHPSSQPSRRPTNSPSSYPTNSPSGYPTSHPSSYPTNSPSSYPTSHPSSQPTNSPSSYPTNSPSSHPTNSPSSYPTNSPSGYPTSHPSSQPTNSSSSYPTNSPSGYPTSHPSSHPTSHPSSHPTSHPSSQPTNSPSSYPTNSPSSQPTNSPSSQPSSQPSSYPTNSPSSYPTNQPTNSPSGYPTNSPSSYPTNQPSSQPSSQPSIQPTDRPTNSPSGYPTSQPSIQPTDRPTNSPSSQPTSQPSSQPSSQPTISPTKSRTGTYSTNTKIIVNENFYIMKITDSKVIDVQVVSDINSVVLVNVNNDIQKTYISAGITTSIQIYIYPNTLNVGYNSINIACNEVTQIISVNIPNGPQGGSIVAKPTNGTEFYTVFEVSALNWTSIYQPLYYTFYIGQLALTQKTTNSKYVGFFSASNKNITVIISDSFGSTTTVTIPITVQKSQIDYQSVNITSMSQFALVVSSTSGEDFIKSNLISTLIEFTNFSDFSSTEIALQYLQILADSSKNLDATGINMTYYILTKVPEYSNKIFTPINTLIESTIIPIKNTISLLQGYANQISTTMLPQTVSASYDNFNFVSEVFPLDETHIVSIADINVSSHSSYISIVQIKQSVENAHSYPISIGSNSNYTVTIPKLSESTSRKLNDESSGVWNGVCHQGEVLNFTCHDSGSVLTQTCLTNGQFTQYCPIPQSVCSVIASDVKCEIVDESSGHATCKCSKGSSDATIILMTTYVTSDLTNVFSATPTFNPSKSSVIFIMYGIFWGVTAVIIISHIKKNKVSIETNNNIPEVFGDKTYLEKIKIELERRHEYFKLLTDRVSTVSVFTIVNMNFFLMALLYDFQYPSNDGSCVSKTTITSCNYRTSYLDSSQTYCKWSFYENDPSEGYCDYNEVNVSFAVNMYCVVFVSVVTFMLSYVVDNLVSNLYSGIKNVATNNETEELNKFFSSTTRKIYEFKKEIDNPPRATKSQYVYYSSILFLTFLNVFFVYYTILKGQFRGFSWQKQYVYACCIQLCLDVLLFGTVECVYMNVILPMFCSADIKVALTLLDDKMEEDDFRQFLNEMYEELEMTRPEITRDPESTEIKVVGNISTFVRIITFIPFELQRVIIRFTQPFVFGGIVIGYSSIGAIYMSLIIIITSFTTLLMYRRYLSNMNKIVPTAN
jgi:hypothetical protein